MYVDKSATNLAKSLSAEAGTCRKSEEDDDEREIDCWTEAFRLTLTSIV